MKKWLGIAVISLIVFVSLTLATAQWETMIDGQDRVGFPLRFFIQHSGECLPCPDEMVETNYFHLVLDFLFAGVVGFVIFKGFEKLSNKRRIL